MHNYFITGASGFVGQHLIKELLKEEGNKVYALIRKRGTISAKERCSILFSGLDEQEFNRIIAVEGEITKPKFGLSETEYSQLVSTIDSIYHTAASIKFNLPYEEAKQINVSGTSHVLELAQSIGYEKLDRFHHISTAYVERNTIANKGLRLYNNTYEQTKYEAETLLKSYDGLPYTIYRPSIISGNSITGEIAESSVIFKFLLMLSKHLLSELPSNIDSSLNIIPVNNFIDQMLALGDQEDSVGKEYFVTNHENVDFVDLITYSCQLMGVKVPDFLPIKDSQQIPKRVLGQIQTFLPYIQQSQVFDLKMTRAILGSSYRLCDSALKTQERIVNMCLSTKLLKPKMG